MTCSVLFTVEPSDPVMSVSPQEIVAGQQITVSCTSSGGVPAAEFTYSMCAPLCAPAVNNYR